jgi:hypothetical protein
MIVSSFCCLQEFVIGCFAEYIKNNAVFLYFLSFTHTRTTTPTTTTTTTTMSDNKTMPPMQSESGIPTNIIQCTDLHEMVQKLYHLPGWLKKSRMLKSLKQMSLSELQLLCLVHFLLALLCF